jgi:hypothetical protein
VTASGKRYKNAARWYYGHSCYQARKKTSTDLLLSDHRPRSSEPATTVITGQHSCTDWPHCSRRIGRLLSRCPPKPASDHRNAATQLNSLAHRLTGNTLVTARQVNLLRLEFLDILEGYDPLHGHQIGSAQTVLLRAVKSQLRRQPTDSGDKC